MENKETRPILPELDPIEARRKLYEDAEKLWVQKTNEDNRLPAPRAEEIKH